MQSDFLSTLLALQSTLVSDSVTDHWASLFMNKLKPEIGLVLDPSRRYEGNETKVAINTQSYSTQTIMQTSKLELYNCQLQKKTIWS